MIAVDESLSSDVMSRIMMAHENRCIYAWQACGAALALFKTDCHVQHSAEMFIHFAWHIEEVRVLSSIVAAQTKADTSFMVSKPIGSHTEQHAGQIERRTIRYIYAEDAYLIWVNTPQIYTIAVCLYYIFVHYAGFMRVKQHTTNVSIHIMAALL